jgi:hypothetical protein
MMTIVAVAKPVRTAEYLQCSCSFSINASSATEDDATTTSLASFAEMISRLRTVRARRLAMGDAAAVDEATGATAKAAGV